MEIADGRHGRNGIPQRCDGPHDIGRGQEKTWIFGGGSGGSTKWSSKSCPERIILQGWAEEGMANVNSPGGNGTFLTETPMLSPEPASVELPKEQSQPDGEEPSPATGAVPVANAQQHLPSAIRSGGQPQHLPDFSLPPRIPWPVDTTENGERRSARTIAPPATVAAKEKHFPGSRVRIITPSPITRIALKSSRQFRRTTNNIHY